MNRALRNSFAVATVGWEALRQGHVPKDVQPDTFTRHGDDDFGDCGKLIDRIQIPSSQCPTGFYRLRRSFLLPRLSTHERVILHFDAITYYGRVICR